MELRGADVYAGLPCQARPDLSRRKVSARRCSELNPLVSPFLFILEVIVEYDQPIPLFGMEANRIDCRPLAAPAPIAIIPC